MNVCDRNEMRALLEKHGFHFSKSKGQNFLTQRWVPQRIAEESGVNQDCGVVEIGPGFGPLTQELCLRAGKVLALELDTTLKPVLSPFSALLCKSERLILIYKEQLSLALTLVILALEENKCYFPL